MRRIGEVAAATGRRSARCTTEQLAQLEERREALGEEGMRKAEADWALLLAEAEALRATGAAPTDPRGA